jgi:hypothetical protein
MTCEFLEVVDLLFEWKIGNKKAGIKPAQIHNMEFLNSLS